MQFSKFVRQFMAIPIYIRATALTISVLIFLVLMATVANSRSGQVIKSPADIKPTISFFAQKNGVRALAVDNDLNIDSWQHSDFLAEPISDCAKATYLGQPSSTNSFVVLSDSQKTSHICFKVSDFSQNTTYAQLSVADILTSNGQGNQEPGATPVEASAESTETTQNTEETPDSTTTTTTTTTPSKITINITQSNGSLIAKWMGQADGYKGSWRVVLLQGNDVCDTALFSKRQYAPQMTNQIHGLTWRDNDSRYCFQLALQKTDTPTLYHVKEVAVRNYPVPAGATTSPMPSSDGQSADNQQMVAVPGEETTTDSGLTTEQSTTTSGNNTSPTDGSKDAEGDVDEVKDNNLLQKIGIGIIIFGVLAIVMVILVARRQQDDEDEGVDDYDDEE